MSRASALLSLIGTLALAITPTAAQSVPLPERPDSATQAATIPTAALTPRLFQFSYADLIPQETGASLSSRLRLGPAPSRRGRNALIGGLIGAATGIITCTVISNIVNDPNTGMSTCDTKAYVAFAAGGAAVGALIGAMIK